MSSKIQSGYELNHNTIESFTFVLLEMGVESEGLPYAFIHGSRYQYSMALNTNPSGGSDMPE